MKKNYEKKREDGTDAKENRWYEWMVFKNREKKRDKKIKKKREKYVKWNMNTKM